MNIEVRELTVRIAVVGTSDRVDAFSAPVLRARLDDLLAQGVSRFVLDLSSVPFLDSAGMAVLVSVLKRSRQADGDVRLVRPRATAVERTLRLTRFDQVFAMVDSAEAGVRGF